MNRSGTGRCLAIAATTPPLGSSVQFRDDETGEADGFVEGSDLRERVLAGVGVEDEHHLVRRARFGLAQYALHFAQFLHQVRLRRQASGRIREHDVDAARARRPPRRT